MKRSKYRKTSFGGEVVTGKKTKLFLQLLMVMLVMASTAGVVFYKNADSASHPLLDKATSAAIAHADLPGNSPSGLEPLTAAISIPASTLETASHMGAPANQVSGGEVPNISTASANVTLTMAREGSGIIYPTTGNHDYAQGTVVIVMATPESGWRFDGWTGDVVNPNSATTPVKMDSNKTVTANFSRISGSGGADSSYTLTMAISGTGTTNPAAGTSTYSGGTVVNISATAATGWRFTGWTGDVGNSNSPSTTITMSANKSVTATFARVQVQYALSTSVSPSQSGTISPASGSYAAGSWVILTATPATGYNFLAWSGDVTGSQNPATVTMDAAKNVTAMFTKNLNILSTSISPTGSGAISPNSGIYAAGSQITLTATPASGYFFSGWGGAVSGSQNPLTLTMGSDMNITATFTKVQNTLSTSISPAGSGRVSPSSGSYAAGSQITLTATPASGYFFSGWGGAASGSQNPFTLTMDSSKAVTATFTKSQYTLSTSISPSGSGSISPGSGSYGAGNQVTLTAIPASGYTFSGWSGATTGTQNPATVTMDANKSVTATFTKVQYTLSSSISPAGGGVISPSSGTYGARSQATLTATPASGYTFTAWGGSASGNQNPLTITMDGNKSITATFTRIQYALSTTVSPAASGTVSPASGSYESGSSVTLTATPSAGYSFSAWSGAITGSQNPVTITMNAARNVTATFTKDVTYTLTASLSPAGSGTISPNSGTYAAGSRVILTATAASGYTFTGWSGAIASTQNPVTITMNAAKSVTATFTKLQYALSTSVSPTASGTISPASGSYAAGSSVVLTATPAAGYSFSAWSGAVTGSQNPVTVTMDAAKSVVATFTNVQYTLSTSLSPSGSGSISPSSGSYAAGSQVTLTATPVSGYSFSSWGGDAFGSQNPLTITMDSNKSISATFSTTNSAPFSSGFYRLRFELSTTSDWVSLQFVNPEFVLASRFVAKSGVSVNADISKMDTGHMILTQPLANATAKQNVSMTVDYALPASILNSPPNFVLKKGNLNQVTLRVYSVSENQLTLIHEVQVGQTTLQFALQFPLNVTELMSITPDPLPNSSTQKLLLAFYYPWYDTSSWNSPNLSDHPLLRLPSSSPALMEAHITQAKNAGIDGFISSWPAPGYYEDLNFKKLLDIAQNHEFQITAYFEALAMNGTLTRDEIAGRLAYLISTYGNHPAFVKHCGKPVIIIYASSHLSTNVWGGIFDELRAKGLDAVFIGAGYTEENLTVFNGIHQYNTVIDPNFGKAAENGSRLVRSYEMLNDPHAQRIWAATVQPGCDDRLLGKTPSHYVDRRNGDTYRQTFEAALQSNPNWIFITSWNEWPENSHIEPGEKYGDQYLQITKEYADKWKNGSKANET
ncbi:MAG: endo-1,3-alpha-glucanase family glycosylhydrolase [Dehalococcoidia bacterium]|nr:endo-1,3-alpha-glucanase family glycosylhydrolase [Dehalococcoidia bacterium]